MTDHDGFSLDDEFVVRTEASKRFPIYTRANVGEVFIGPTTPLTSSSMSDGRSSTPGGATVAVDGDTGLVTIVSI